MSSCARDEERSWSKARARWRRGTSWARGRTTVERSEACSRRRQGATTETAGRPLGSKVIYLRSLLSGRADSNCRPPAPKPEAARSVYQQKRSFSLVGANIRNHMGTVWLGRVPLVLLPGCYLGRPAHRRGGRGGRARSRGRALDAGPGLRADRNGPSAPRAEQPLSRAATGASEPHRHIVSTWMSRPRTT
jgi:hypothetical protein